MGKDKLSYVVIGVLLSIMFLQWKNGCGKPSKDVTPVEIVKVDTLYDTVYVHDTIVGEPDHVYHHYDTTIWVKEPEHVPSEVYEELYKQYITLGNEHFSTNGYVTRFPIDTFGYVTVYDTIQGNKLISNKLVSELMISEKTIVVEKLRQAQPQMYIGGGFFSDGIRVVNGAQLGLLYRDRKDRIYGLSGGAFGGAPAFGISYYRKF